MDFLLLFGHPKTFVAIIRDDSERSVCIASLNGAKGFLMDQKSDIPMMDESDPDSPYKVGW